MSHRTHHSPLVLAVALVVAWPPAALAGVYRWVDAEGRTQFSDRPQPGVEAQALPIKPAPALTPAATTAPVLGPYKALEIVSPEANQTLRLDSDSLPVSLIIDPPLLPGHRLQLVLDGTPIPVASATGAQLALTGVTIGSHLAQVQVLDAEDLVLARSATVSFHLRKPIPPGVIQ